jgi:hypothetical protein
MWSIVAIGWDSFVLHERRSDGAPTPRTGDQAPWIVEIF